MSLLLCNNEEDGKERYLAGALMVGLKMVRTSSRILAFRTWSISWHWTLKQAARQGRARSSEARGVTGKGSGVLVVYMCVCVKALSNVDAQL
jgi:hypothetical protein